MKSLSVATLIKIFIAVGLLAVFAVIVQSCGRTKDQITPSRAENIKNFATGSLAKLDVKDPAIIQPRMKVKTAAGEEMALYDYTGEYVVVNLWATWCAPCIIEMPSLNRLAELRSDKIEVVTISLDRTAEEAAEFMTENDLENLKPWHDASLGLATRLGFQGLPGTVIYDRDGNEVARLAGPAEWDSEEALALIDYLTGG